MASSISSRGRRDEAIEIEAPGLPQRQLAGDVAMAVRRTVDATAQRLASHDEQADPFDAVAGRDLVGRADEGHRSTWANRPRELGAQDGQTRIDGA